MQISLIVAMTEGRVIGRDGGMPWHISSDLKRFKSLTMGKPMIMGGKTHRSIGSVLAGRDNIVITRDPGSLAKDATPARDFDSAIELAKISAARDGVTEIMVVGGGEIYRQALETADRIYLTLVHQEVAGDTYFPVLNTAVWREVAREDHLAGPNDSSDFSFILLERTGETS